MKHLAIEQIRAEMKRRGMTQQQMADALGVKRQLISARLSGHTSPTLRSLTAMAEVVGLCVVAVPGD